MTSGTLWTGIVCPQHALQALTRVLPDVDPAHPLVVYEPLRGRDRVIEASRAARELGVRPGQPLADALVIAPMLEALARNRQAERQLFETVALAAFDFSHQVAITGDGVILETGRSRRLHNGLERLLEALRARLGALGIAVRLGHAPVPAAACLLARHGKSATDLDALRARLRRWPLDKLMLADAELEKLAGLGLERLDEVLDLPRFEFRRRLGDGLARHLDRLLGIEATPLAYWAPPERFRLKLELPVPSGRIEALLFALNRMLAELETWLRVRDRALTGLEVELRPENGHAPIRLHAALSQPGFRRDRLLEILRLKLEPVRLTEAIETLVLGAESTAEHRPPQADLWTGANTADAWPALLDRLAARIGIDNLRGITPCPDHRPEKAWRWTEPGVTVTPTACPPRPAWLLPEPRPCRVERLRLLDGPERIESGWWDGDDCRRDYWTAHDRHGNRLWVFREYKPRRGWFVHGLFG